MGQKLTNQEDPTAHRYDREQMTHLLDTPLLWVSNARLPELHWSTKNGHEK